MKLEYPFNIRHLSNEEGGGYLIEFPDLPGCMSDGETIDEAIMNGQEAIKAWILAAKEMNRTIPKAGELESQSGKWVQRVPKSVHLRLVNRAKEEGVSLNTLVITMLAESLGVEYGKNKLNVMKHAAVVKESSSRKYHAKKKAIKKKL
jgi:antitoxin HicB